MARSSQPKVGADSLGVVGCADGCPRAIVLWSRVRGIARQVRYDACRNVVSHDDSR